MFSKYIRIGHINKHYNPLPTLQFCDMA